MSDYYERPLPVLPGRATRDHVCGNCRQPGTNMGATGCKNFRQPFEDPDAARDVYREREDAWLMAEFDRGMGWEL